MVSFSSLVLSTPSLPTSTSMCCSVWQRILHCDTSASSSNHQHQKPSQRTLHPVRQAQGSADSECFSRSRSCDNMSFDTLGDDISQGSKDQEVEMTSPMANINRRLSKTQMAIEVGFS
jgi:hypothetical protein